MWTKARDQARLLNQKYLTALSHNRLEPRQAPSRHPLHWRIIAQVKPWNSATLNRRGQIVQSAGLRRKAKVKDRRNLSLRRPEQVGGMPVIMRPQRSLARQPIAKPMAKLCKDPGQFPCQSRARR
jgi:hypothetical protein